MGQCGNSSTRVLWNVSPQEASQRRTWLPFHLSLHLHTAFCSPISFLSISRRTARRLAVLWPLAIAVACVWPGTGLPKVSPALSLDKLVHVGLFGGLGFLWMQAGGGSLRLRAVRVTASGLLFAAASEGAQGLIAIGRTPSWADALADAIGLLLAVAAFLVFPQLRRERASPASSERGH